MNDDLLEKKQKLNDEIVNLREELLSIQEKINNLGKGNSFFRIFIIPFITSLVLILILRLVGINGTQSLGLFLLAFIVTLTITTVRMRKENEKKENILIKDRMNIQHKIMKKVKELNELNDSVDSKGHNDESN